MNHLASQFLYNMSEKTAIDLLRLCRCDNYPYLGTFIAKYMETTFPKSREIKEEKAAMHYVKNEHVKAFDTFNRLLRLRSLGKDSAECAVFNRHFSISDDKVANRYNYYNPSKVQMLLKYRKKRRTLPMVTVTITSCKRLDLFTQTLNSFINCVEDLHLIDEWLCVDDNSSEEDREKMCKLYPFIKFYFKSPPEKGHPQSMNIIRKLVKTPYIFHMEDDWKFIEKRSYISDCLNVLGQNDRIGQCLINRNYAELGEDQITGGLFCHTDRGIRYYIHEYCSTEEEKEVFTKKYGSCAHCSYWPHFSLRPSLLRREVLDKIGEFNEQVSHFEMDYSYRYVERGYISAFLEGVYSLHIGRLTKDRHDKNIPNAYELNGEIQFGDKSETSPAQEQQQHAQEQQEQQQHAQEQQEQQQHAQEHHQHQQQNKMLKIKTFVINLQRRPDRWVTFLELEEPKFLRYNRFEAIDGKKLVATEQLQQIFTNNDYNMRSGMVGCALSHIKLYIQLLQEPDVDAYCILEDDIEFVPDFKDKFIFCINQLMERGWDMFYLGHHLWREYIDENVYSKTLWPKVEQFNRAESLRKSMGGTGGYVITKKGAEKLLEFINRNGMTNGIDTMQQKSADELNVFYAYPHLIYTECYRGDNTLDTDIQHDYTSLTIPLKERLERELAFYGNNITLVEDIHSIPESITRPIYYVSDDMNVICRLKERIPYPSYTLENKVLFILPKESERYCHRFKKNGQWNIDEALTFY
jgi:GR25 family glycosyltransferase involved in LPS biosynthesis